MTARESFLRTAMYAQLRPYLSGLAPERVLSISGADGLVGLLSPGGYSVELTEFPQVRMEDLPYPDGSFDLVLSDQVLEHTEQPFRAVSESLRVLRPGGRAIHTTCFMNPVHADPSDYWRFTPAALARLCGEGSSVVTGAWGNRAAVVLVLFGQRRLRSGFLTRRLVARLQAKNDPRCPLVTWVIADKT